MKYKIILPSIYFDSEGLAVATDCYLVGPNGTLNAPYKNRSRSKRKQPTEVHENERKKPVEDKVSLELKRVMVNETTDELIDREVELDKILQNVYNIANDPIFKYVNDCVASKRHKNKEMIRLLPQGSKTKRAMLEMLEFSSKNRNEYTGSCKNAKSPMVSLANEVSVSKQTEKERIQFTDNGVIATEEYKTLIFHPVYLKVNSKFIYFALSDRNEVSVNEFRNARKNNHGYAVEYDVSKDTNIDGYAVKYDVRKDTSSNGSAVEYDIRLYMDTQSKKQTNIEPIACKSAVEIKVSDMLPLSAISSEEIFRGVGLNQTNDDKVMRSEIDSFITKDSHYSSITQTIPLSQKKVTLEATTTLQDIWVYHRVDKTGNSNTISVKSNTNKQEMEHTLQVVFNQTELEDKEKSTNTAFDMLAKGDKMLDCNKMAIEKHKLLKIADNIQEPEDDEDDIFNEIMVTHQKHLLRYKQLLKAENSPFFKELPRDNVRSENEFGRVEKETSTIKTRKAYDFDNKTSEVNTQHKIIKPKGTVLQRITKVHRKRLSGYREIESLEISLIENKLKDTRFNFFRKFKLRKKLRFHQKKLKNIEYFEEKFIVEELLRANARSGNEFLNI